MKRLARAAIISRLADELHKRDSWVGETHIQKAAFFLQEAAGVPLDYEFFLYKHGPFAFDLRSDLGSFRVDEILELRPQGYPYGPRLYSTPLAAAIQDKFPKTLGSAAGDIEAVANFIGGRGVGELERLGTALLLIQEDEDATDEDLAAKMIRIKPHVSLSSATDAVTEVREFLDNIPSS